MDELSDTIAAPGALAAYEHNSVYELLREEIIEGRLTANERLKVSALAERYGTSTNPVREALQQLRGEGFVVIEPNRGARVRPVDETFLRDTYEMEVLIEPYLTRWFVGVATDADVVRLEAIQAEIEAHNFADVRHNSSLDTQFHLVFYDHHYNRHAVELWWRHREILSAISRRYPHSLKRRARSGRRAPRIDRPAERARRRRRRRTRRPARRRFRAPSHRASTAGSPKLT